MSLLLTTKQDSYRQQRSASNGAGITLIAGCGEYSASFECANRCAAILGKRDLRDIGDGIYESIPIYKIPLEEINLALLKLSARYSIALIDLVCDKASSRFVLVWKIIAPLSIPPEMSVSTNLDDY